MSSCIGLDTEVDDSLSQIQPVHGRAGDLMMHTFTTKGVVICAVSEMTFSTPADQNHHLTLSLMAKTKLGRFFPVFVRHSCSSSLRLPFNIHKTDLQPGLIFPAAKRSLYSFTSLTLSSYDTLIFSAIWAAERESCNLYTSVASRGRA